MRYIVPPEATGLSLGRYLYDRLKLSRNLVRRAKATSSIWIDGQPAQMNRLLCGGEEVLLQVTVQGKTAPEPVPLQICFEDRHLLVVEKPSGMVVHPVKEYKGGTLANGVAYHLLQRGEEPVARPVLRIDRDTTGLVLFAKDPATAQYLARDLEKHKLARSYIGFVHGRVAADAGVANLPIRRVWGHPVAREVATGLRTPEQEALLAEAKSKGQRLREEWTGGGQRAVTHWTVLRRWSAVSLLSLRLETGRTHQIRVHMAHLGHPLLGDTLYGRGEGLGRQALHAATLAFTHPATGEALSFESPLPADMQALLDQLERTI